MHRDPSAQVLDALLPARLAELLADHGERGLTDALELLVSELQLRSAVLRDGDAVGAPSGHGARPLRAVAGDPAHAVPAMRVLPSADGTTVEHPLRAAGRPRGVLTLVGVRPSQLPVLRAAAAVLALALSRPAAPPVPPLEAAGQLVAAADGDADEVADRLHDGPVQALIVARYAADAAVRGADPTVARDAVQNALVELRRALWHVRPRGAADGGLAAALGLLSARLAEAGGTPLGYVVDEPVADALSYAVVSIAYRLVQAVAVPDGAPPVRITVRREGATAVIDVDGGTPLVDPERWAVKARALGGTLTPSEGRLRLAVPLDQGTKANP